MTQQIKFEDVFFTYNEKSFNQTEALNGINLEFSLKEYIGVVGHTGSGKSTFANLLARLEKPTKGKIIFPENIFIPLVFQFAEKQFFEETIIADLLFGPLNQGFSHELAREMVTNALKLVGISNKRYDTLSPFELSGGEQRRLAIAAILAMNYDFVIFDEPTVGLDVEGLYNLNDLMANLRKTGKGYLIISHSTDFLVENTDRIIGFKNGMILFDEKIENLENNIDKFDECNSDIPSQLQIFIELKKKKIINNDAIFNKDFLNEYFK